MDLSDHATERATHDFTEGSLIDDDDDPDADREGRFYGPDSSWRFYTHDVRALASSLERIQNNDLSIHLYNTHALKSYNHLQNPTSDIVPYRGKRSWRAPPRNVPSAICPPNSWTSWPLPPDDVPRQRETWGVPTEHPHEQPGTYFKLENWKPRTHLEDEICASALRIVKEQVRRRVWASQSSDCGSPTDDLQVADSGELNPSNSAQGERTDPSRRRSTEEACRRDHEQLRSRLLPSLCIDEEANTWLLRPTIGHLIARVDDLLSALHRNRRGHRVSGLRPHDTGNGSRSRSRRRTKPKTQSESPAKRRRLDTDTEVNIDGDTHTAVPEASDRNEVRTRNLASRSSLAPRDWSEVLSIAALVGWDPKVIQTAAHRCAVLLGEGMELRSMPEANSKNDRIDRYAPDMISPLDVAAEHSDSDISLTSGSETAESKYQVASRTAICCPELGCTRDSEPFQSRWRLREHLRRKHRYSKDEVNELVPKIGRTTKACTPVILNTGAAVHDDCLLQPVVIKDSSKRTTR